MSWETRKPPKPGLVEFGAGVRFRHPLLRSAVYRAASVTERRAVHATLAEVTDPLTEPDRRAWHRAKAAPGPDEQVPAELERCAGRAQARGGMAASAAFLERAVLLTIDPARRAERTLAAAQANLQAGAFGHALELLATAEIGPLHELQSDRVDLLRGEVAFASGLGSDAPPLLLKAASRLEPLDLNLARETYLTAWMAALFAGPLAGSGDLLEVSRAARALPAPTAPPRPAEPGPGRPGPVRHRRPGRRDPLRCARRSAPSPVPRSASTTNCGGAGWPRARPARCGTTTPGGPCSPGTTSSSATCTQLRPELARAHLLYGEWLRREHRRVESRVPLRAAYDLLGSLGMRAFAERAQRELAATGETVRKRAPEEASALTAQETHIARLAVQGRTNAEIGAQLFISARIVEWHLRKIFTKLDVTSRGNCARLWAAPRISDRRSGRRRCAGSHR